MGNPLVPIDSWEHEEHKFKYPRRDQRGKEIPEEDLTPLLIKALKDGLGENLNT